MDGWWIIGESLRSNNTGLAHQSARLTMNGYRVQQCSNSKDIWDLTDSVLELYEMERRLESTISFENHHKSQTINKWKNNPEIWLKQDPRNGFIRVFLPNLSNYIDSQLIACTLKTRASQICLDLNIAPNCLHIQLNGDKVRRLNEDECPLLIQNDYLVTIGFNSQSDIYQIQNQGLSIDLAYLVKFFSGKPLLETDNTLSHVQQGNVTIKYSKNWNNKYCVVYGTRLHVYKDENKIDKPLIYQLSKGYIERIKIKAGDHTLKINLADNDKSIYLAFKSDEECECWYEKLKKASDILPTNADLSNCHLEYIPENMFINSQLTVLNLQRNTMKQRPLKREYGIVNIGWIDDLSRFEYLRTLNLSDNLLYEFPVSICQIYTLVELNLSNNKLSFVPPSIENLRNLQVLHLHNNQLTNLPDQILKLQKLLIIVVAFNHFTILPMVLVKLTNIRISEVENIIVTGNEIENIDSKTLMEMRYVKKLDLRLNRLTLNPTEVTNWMNLDALTHLDLRDNRISHLDIRCLKSLEYLYCQRNTMSSLMINGLNFKYLSASYNCLEEICIQPRPENLIYFDVSDNCLDNLPEWLSECYSLQKLLVSENFIKQLPTKLFTLSNKLLFIDVSHNHLTSLPHIGSTNLCIEEIRINHNFITQLPSDLFLNLNKLNILSATRNLLTELPPCNSNYENNRLQELYLSCNALTSNVMKIIAGFPRLKILHLANNEIDCILEEDIIGLSLLQILNISSNQLVQLPPVIGKMPSLMVLRAHTNFLRSLPDFKHAKELRVLDVGHNKLKNVSVTDLMASQLNLLDMSMNDQLHVDPHNYKNIKKKKAICLVDVSGTDRLLPGLKKRKFCLNNNDLEDEGLMSWKVGLSESCGMRNKLCIQMLRLLNFNHGNESLFGMFDGGRNNELPKILVKKIGDILKEEILRNPEGDRFMRYAILSAHRQLKSSGQRLGVSIMLCHIKKCEKTESRVQKLILTVGNVGDTEAIMCRKRESVLLTKKFSVGHDMEELNRVLASDAIITEENKINGISSTTRILGCSHLFPHLIASPFTASVTLQPDDEFIIIANNSFWKLVSYEEAIEEIYDIGNPVVASKHLQDIAEGYGSNENIAVLVIRLNTELGPSLGKLRPVHRNMSIDDVQAAMQYDMQRIKPVRMHPCNPHFRNRHQTESIKLSQHHPKPIFKIGEEIEVTNAKMNTNCFLQNTLNSVEFESISFNQMLTSDSSADCKNTSLNNYVITNSLETNDIEADVKSLTSDVTNSNNLEIKKKCFDTEMFKKDFCVDYNETYENNLSKVQNLNNNSSIKNNETLNLKKSSESQINSIPTNKFLSKRTEDVSPLFRKNSRHGDSRSKSADRTAKSIVPSLFSNNIIRNSHIMTSIDIDNVPNPAYSYIFDNKDLPSSKISGELEGLPFNEKLSLFESAKNRTENERPYSVQEYMDSGVKKRTAAPPVPAKPRFSLADYQLLTNQRQMNIIESIHL